MQCQVCGNETARIVCRQCGNAVAGPYSERLRQSAGGSVVTRGDQTRISLPRWQFEGGQATVPNPQLEELKQLLNDMGVCYEVVGAEVATIITTHPGSVWASSDAHGCCLELREKNQLATIAFAKGEMNCWLEEYSFGSKVAKTAKPKRVTKPKAKPAEEICPQFQLPPVSLRHGGFEL